MADNSIPPGDSSHILSVIKDSHDKDIARVEEKIGTLGNESKARDKALLDRLNVVSTGINNKLEEIDVAFRGNSRIGIFEQLRNAKRSIRVIFILIALLIGIKLWGSNLTEWWDDFKKDYGLSSTAKVVAKVPEVSVSQKKQ